MIRNLTESGDFYRGTLEAWQRYRKAVNSGDVQEMLKMEEGYYDDFQYDP